jgi:hypothetical protein
MARRHRDDGPARTRTGREVGVDAPGTGTTERAANGPQWFYWGRAAVVDVEAAARRFFPALGSRCVRPDGTCEISHAHPLGCAGHPLRERRFLLARYEYAPRHVVDARYLGDYKVWLEFNDGRKGIVDLVDELHGEELEPLRDRDRFSQFYLDYGLASIAWLDGQDFTPEFLYDKLTPMH